MIKYQIQKSVLEIARRSRKLGTLFLVLTTILWALGVPIASFLPGLPVSTALAVSGVTGADTDTASPGLDGRDFSISWTPGTAPAGYTDTQIFIFPALMDPLPTANNVLTTGCSSSACQPRGFFAQFQQNNTTLPQFTTADSAGTTLAAGSYKACVFTNATTDTLDCTAAAFTVASDTVTDTNSPMIEHMSVNAAQAETDAVINAFVIDDQTTEEQFANAGDGEAEYFKLAYGSNVATAETRVDGINVSGKLFQFTVPSAAVPAAGGTFQYYITAKDRAGNERFFCANPSAATSTACKAAPFIVTTVVAGDRTIAGTISYNTSSGTPSALASAKVFPAGFAKAAVTADGVGVYTITGLPNNTPIDVTAYLASYTKNMRMEMVGTSNLTGVNINLNQGDLGFYTGGGDGMFAGDMSPHVIFSGPPDNSQNVPLSENIRVGINQPLNAQTVNDADASNAGSNVYLTSDGSTKIAGTVTWCQSNASPGCSALMSMDTNTILFNPTADLTANTFYTLIITEAVTSESGQSIAGNRAGGGHRIGFTTSAGATFSGSDLSTNFGSGGQYLPPYVKSTLPAPGNSVAPNVRPLVEFNETMSLGTLTSTNIKLVKLPSTAVTSTVSIDSTETRFVTLTPQTTPANTLTAGDYEIQVLGAVANARGMTMRTGAEASSIAFRTTFTVSGTSDSTPPTIYPLVANNGTITVNEGRIEFGFNEPLAAGTVTSSNITLKRGSTAVTANIVYNASENSVYVIPEAALMPNTSYNVTFGTSVTDLSGNALLSAATYTYTTGSADTVAPKLKEARCDDYTCTIFFNEPMNHETAADTNYANSVLKQANWTVQRIGPLPATPESPAAIDISGKPTTYNGEDYSVTIQGVAGLAYGDTFRVTASTNIQDIAKNAVSSVSSANILVGAVENSQATFGSFGDTGMFGPPVAGVGTMGPPVAGVAGTTVTLGGEFKPQGFGTFTAEQFAMGQADMAYPFNPMASQSSNVFQVVFGPGAVLQDDDLVELTFPKGTGITSASPDTFSPFKNDFNFEGVGTVTFDNTYDTDGVAVDTTAMTVTVKLAITGTPGSGDRYTIDLKNITNPSVPKGPESGGYTVDIKVKRGTPAQIVVNKTSMPYFIMAGGSRSITVKVYAGTAVTGTAGATGDVHMWGGGPGGPMDKLVTLTNGITTAADGTAIGGDAGIVFSSLPDGCYNFGTEPFVTLGGADYFGQMSPESVCVNSATPNATKNIVLGAASGAGTVNVTVKLAGIASFNGADVDIFAGGPGRFVAKTLTSLDAPNADGYTITLNANGHWNIGVGPAMPKGTSMSMPKSLPGIPPPPTDIIVSGLPGTGAIAQGFKTPPGVSVDTTTKTITFTFATADKTVTGTVTDGTSGLANVNVFMHALGFGQPAFTMTKSDGTFSLNVSDYGTYEIGVATNGLPPVMNNIEIRTDGADAGTDPDIFYKGKQIVVGTNPLVIKLKKGAYTISGKVLDSSNNAISYAPVFATDANGNSANGGTSSDGSYTIFVDAGIWTVKSMLPPDKTDVCGTLEKSVTITTESKSSQNITPSTGTCYTVSGTVTVAGATLNNAPIFVDEWDTTNNRPVAGGTFKGTSTNSSGVYSVKVKGSTTYHIGTWDPTYGEISITQAVTTADVASADINSGTTGTVTMAFTGGSASHEAFIELKKADDNFTRVGKTQKGLASNVTFTMKEGTYNYFVDVFGVGKYSGTVATGATATIDLSSSSLITLSGNVKDENSSNVSGALITAKASDGTTKTVTTDSSGNYSLSAKSGTYTVSASKSQHIAGQAPASVSLTTTTTNYDFGGASPDQAALNKTDQVITGTIYQSNGSTAATNAFVTATESTTGATVTAPVDAVTGVYTLPVDDGTWTIKAVAPLHAKTTKSDTVVVTGTDDSTGSSNNITLTADATKTSASGSTSLSAASGGSFNDTDNTGMKITAGQGVLEAGNVTVSMDIEKTFTAPDTDTFVPLANAAFTIEAENAETDSNIKDLKGNAEIQIDYTSLLSSLPSGASEADFKLAYYSQEKDAYIPVEGGYTVDATNNVISGQVDHFTDFAIVYSPVAAAGVGSSSGDTTPPALPTNVSLTPTSSKVTLSWTDSADADFYRAEILRNAGGTTPVSGEVYAYVNKGTQTFVDTAVNAGTTYKYQIRVRDYAYNSRLSDEYSVTVATSAAPGGGGGSSGSGATTTTPTTTPVVTTPATTTTTETTVTSTPAPAPAAAPVAVLIKDPTKLDEILSGLSVARNQSEEAKYMPLIKSDAIAYKVGLTEAQETALTNFVSYGISAKTKNLGAGERRALVRDYLETVGRANVNWEDMDRLAKGEKPVSRNLAKEQAKVNSVLSMFKKMVGHMPNFKDANEDLSWNTMMYRIRFERDLDKEKAGIVEFRKIFKYTPKSPLDWSAVRALGYVLP